MNSKLPYSWILLWITFQYFRIAVSASCFKTTITAEIEPDYLTTPNYPFPYDTSMTCEWELVANTSINNAVIKFQVMDSQLRQAMPCWIDSITIHDGPRDWYPSLYSWCGLQYPRDIISSTRRSARVVFKSGSTLHSFRGVRLKYWAAEKVFPQKKAVEMTWINYTLIAVFFGTVFVIITTLVTTFIVHRKRSNAKVNIYKLTVP